MSKNSKLQNEVLERVTVQTVDPKIAAVPNLSNLYRRPVRFQQTQELKEPKESKESREPKAFKKPAFKPLQVLDSFTNAAGVVFNPGDKILVSAPWGGAVTAEIASFYQDNSGNAWAKYKPIESRTGWSWERGFVRASLLIKA